MKIRAIENLTLRHLFALTTEALYRIVNCKSCLLQDFVSPVTAAQTMLHSACKKRKEMLQKTMGLLLQIIQESVYNHGNLNQTPPPDRAVVIFAVVSCQDKTIIVLKCCEFNQFTKYGTYLAGRSKIFEI
jgi:hypothetical protein